MDSKVANGNYVVLCGLDLGFVHRKADHGKSFSCREWVVQCMAELSAPDGDYNFRKFLKNVLNAMQMAQMKWLVSPDQETPVLIRIQVDRSS